MTSPTLIEEIPVSRSRKEEKKNPPWDYLLSAKLTGD